jgi:hypothetical protein
MLSLLVQIRRELEKNLARHRKNRDTDDPDSLFVVTLVHVAEGRTYSYTFAVCDTSGDYYRVESVRRQPPPPTDWDFSDKV